MDAISILTENMERAKAQAEGFALILKLVQQAELNKEDLNKVLAAFDLSAY